MRTFELALRRAQLGVAYTQGFNPRPKLAFAMALPLGVESLDELVDIDFLPKDAPAPADLVARLGGQMPAGIVLREAWFAARRARVAACDFEVELDLPAPEVRALAARLDSFMAGGAVMHSRSRGKGKRPRVLDVRAFTLSANLDGSRLCMRIGVTPQGAMKPTDLLEILGLDALAQRVVKTKTVLEEEAPGTAHHVERRESTVNGDNKSQADGR
jgi:radical SAM-linked protein